MRAMIRFEIHTFWHCGTGRGSGSELDALVFRTPAGLPCLPGRTVKGLLREAVRLGEKTGELKAGRTERWFGTGMGDDESARDNRERVLEERRFATEPGALTVGSAVLGEDRESALAWERWGGNHAREVSRLFFPFASTKIDERGLAAEHTLRSIEVSAPMALRAPVEGRTDPDWRPEIVRVLPFLRSLGSHRNRGLGRVTATLEEVR